MSRNDERPALKRRIRRPRPNDRTRRQDDEDRAVAARRLC
jgi:hypothetical protein